MFGGACGPNAGISPYALEYVKLLVRYLQQKPGVAEVSYLVHHAVCTIGTLVIDVLRPDPNPSVNRPRDILGLMSGELSLRQDLKSYEHGQHVC